MNSTKSNSYKEFNPLIAYLKKVHVALIEQLALVNIDKFAELIGF